jgi:hypothetical protein
MLTSFRGFAINIMRVKRAAILAAVSASGLYVGSLALSSPSYAEQATAATPASAFTQASETNNVETSAASSQQDPRPGPGTLLLGELIKPLDAKKVKVGDPVECRLLQDLLYKGKVIVSHKARAWGHITDVVVASKGHPGSEIGLAFDKVIMPDKKEVPFQYPAIIIALAAPIHRTAIQTTNMTDLPVLMSKGQATGASAMGAVEANAQLAGANMPASNGAISVANRGVIGLQNLTLDNTKPSTSLIISSKGNLRLDFDAQVVLQVTAPAK